MRGSRLWRIIRSIVPAPHHAEGKVTAVLPELIANCGAGQKGMEIRERALDLGVFAERAFVDLEEVFAIDPNAELRRES
jgi:hypothetical protein